MNTIPELKYPQISRLEVELFLSLAAMMTSRTPKAKGP